MLPTAKHAHPSEGHIAPSPPPVHAHSSHAHLVHVHRFAGKKRKESEAATKVQAQVRGQQARKSVSGMKKCGGWCKCFSSAKA